MSWGRPGGGVQVGQARGAAAGRPQKTLPPSGTDGRDRADGTSPVSNLTSSSPFSSSFTARLSVRRRGKAERVLREPPPRARPPSEGPVPAGRSAGMKWRWMNVDRTEMSFFK